MSRSKLVAFNQISPNKLEMAVKFDCSAPQHNPTNMLAVVNVREPV